MTPVYLFDWGDTLMVDHPEQTGPMCDWSEVTAVNGVVEALAILSKSHRVYVATNAADSSEEEIKRAFERVGLAQYINGYFCKSNLGIGKGSPAFFEEIVQHLGVNSDLITMVGDSYNNDIAPAISAGLKAIWVTPNSNSNQAHDGVNQISNLRELCE